MRVLLSALGCNPNKGSEPHVAYRTLMAAASRHDVWLLTNNGDAEVLSEHLDGHQLRKRIRIYGIPLGYDVSHEPSRGLVQFHYDRWQRRAGKLGLALDADVDFDLVHHVSFAAYWMRSGVAEVNKPFVLGPVGGGVHPPLGLVCELGVRGAVTDAGRIIGRWLYARTAGPRRTRAQADLILLQNPATGKRFRARGERQILPNALAAEVETSSPITRTNDIVVVGRLLPLKGGTLALRAFRHVSHPNARLRFYGDGSELPRLQKRAQRLGLEDVVSFERTIPRAALLARVAAAGVLLHPALHEEASLAVAEALMLGTPVVTLDHGGPAEVVRRFPDAPAICVSPSTPRGTARRIASAVEQFLDCPPPPGSAPRFPTTRYADSILAVYDQFGRQGVEF